MSNPTARPEAQEYLIFDTIRQEWWTGAANVNTVRVEHAQRYRREIAEAFVGSIIGSHLRAVPLSQALEGGPPNMGGGPSAAQGEQETPEARTRREIAELPVPRVGERWYHCDGEPVIVLRVRRIGPTDADAVIDYLLENRGWREERTLRSWYGYERPGVRRFQRERPDFASTIGRRTMQVCPDCGSKRCPRATDRGVVCMEPAPINGGAVLLDQPHEAKENPFSFRAAWGRTAKRAHEIACAKGWHSPSPQDGTLIALMHSELSEALEAMRRGNPASKKIPAFSQVEEELADVVIRIMDFAGLHGLDLGGAIEAKMAMNEGRSYRHGGKAF